MDPATATEIDPAKTANKWVVQKTAENTGDLIKNKNEREDEPKERQEMQIPPEKRKQTINDLKLF